LGQFNNRFELKKKASNNMKSVLLSIMSFVAATTLAATAQANPLAQKAEDESLKAVSGTCRLNGKKLSYICKVDLVAAAMGEGPFDGALNGKAANCYANVSHGLVTHLIFETGNLRIVVDHYENTCQLAK
jgi:hypothetical protein